MITMYAPLSPMQKDVLTLLVSGWTTPVDALERAGCFSLSQRVGDLIRAGYAIEKGWHVTNVGKSVRKYRAAANA